MQLLATWTFHLPPIHRLYLPAVAPRAVLAALDFHRSPSKALAFGSIAVHPTVNYTIGAAGLFIGS